MDPAVLHRALASQGAMLDQQQQVQTMQENLDSELSVEHFSLQLSRLVPQQLQEAVSAPGATVVAASPPHSDSYACDLEPFSGSLDRCCGFLLQCRLFFS